MKIQFRFVCFLIACIMANFVYSVRALTFHEHFGDATNSWTGETRGWRSFGDTNLFHWNETNKNLDVTWDSAKPNSFFYRPLGTILNRSNDFSVSFDLLLNDVGFYSEKPNGFQIAVGFLNLQQATNAAFLRGTGMDSPNLVEFSYFPPAAFGATISPTIISSNNEFGYSFAFGELTPGEWFTISMTYTASNSTMKTVILKSGQPFIAVADFALDSEFFTDFSVDAFSITSYSDEGQFPDYAGSVLVHGAIDNVTVTTPASPVRNFKGEMANDNWNVSFGSEPTWTYFLERTSDFKTWETVSFVVATDFETVLQDVNRPSGSAFYRVRAEAP